MLPSGSLHGRKGKGSLQSLSYQGAISSRGLHLHDLRTSQRPHDLTLSQWALGFQHMNGVGDTFRSQHQAVEERDQCGDHPPMLTSHTVLMGLHLSELLWVVGTHERFLSSHLMMEQTLNRLEKKEWGLESLAFHPSQLQSLCRYISLPKGCASTVLFSHRLTFWSHPFSN